MPGCADQLLEDVISLCVCLGVIKVQGSSDVRMAVLVWQGAAGVQAAMDGVLKNMIRSASQANALAPDQAPQRWTWCTRPELRSIVSGHRLSERPIVVVCQQLLLVMAAQEARGETEALDINSLTEELAPLLVSDKESVRTWLRVAVDTLQCFGAVEGPSQVPDDGAQGGATRPRTPRRRHFHRRRPRHPHRPRHRPRRGPEQVGFLLTRASAMRPPGRPACPHPALAAVSSADLAPALAAISSPGPLSLPLSSPRTSRCLLPRRRRPRNRTAK